MLPPYILPQGRKHRERSILISKIFVGNLNYETTTDQLETLFEQVGQVREVFLPTDRHTGRPRGFAFVEFEDPSVVGEAIERFDGHDLGGRQIRINEARERAPRIPSFDGPPSFKDGPPGARPARPKGSRRNLRGRKRRL